MKKNTYRLTLCAVLTAFSLALFALELLIPPFPFAPSAKIGLANIVTLFMLTNKQFFTCGDCFLVLTARCILAALITGNITAVVFSLSGGFLALAVMLLVCRLTYGGSAVLISIFGAVFHNLGQMAVALLFYGTFSVIYYIPALFLAGVLCGILTGLCVILINRSRFYKNIFRL